VEQHIQQNDVTLPLDLQKIPTICRKRFVRHNSDRTLPMRNLFERQIYHDISQTGRVKKYLIDALHALL